MSEPRYDEPQEQHLGQVYMYEHVKMIRESWINYSMKASVSHYTKKVFLHLEETGIYTCELLKKMQCHNTCVILQTFL